MVHDAGSNTGSNMCAMQHHCHSMRPVSDNAYEPYSTSATAASKHSLNEHTH